MHFRTPGRSDAIFGYRLVPQDLYDVMVTALKERVSSSPVPPTSPVDQTTVKQSFPSQNGHFVTGLQVVDQAKSAPPLPQAVIDACELYGFGNRDDVAANFRVAQTLHAKEAPAEVIIERIRAGESVALFT